MTTQKPTPLTAEIVSFARWLRFANKSEKTIDVYTSAARKFAGYVREHGVDDWTQVTPEHIRDFTIAVLDTRSAGYGNHLFRSLQQYLRWWADEHEAPNPMAGLKPPAVPEQEVPVLRAEQLKALLKSCAGREFVQRRDLAVIYLFLDSGLRRTELANLTVEDVDLDHREVTVLGKGRRHRAVSFGRRTAWSLDRYLSERARHKQAEMPALWLGEKGKGPMTPSGIYQMIERRGRAVGIEGLHPHQIRHTWAHLLKRADVSGEELMKLAGWRSPQMLARYAASTASERARDTGRRVAPGDRL